MDFAKLKNLIKTNGDKFVFIENDVPEIVMMSFQEYERLTVGHPELSEGSQKSPVAEVLETDRPEETEFVIPLGPALQSPGGPATGPYSVKSVRLEDIRLEDLPL